MNQSQRVVVVIVGLGLLVAAAGIGFWLGRHEPPVTAAVQADANHRDRKILYWYDPMQPDQHFDKPGKSPFMDMDLVPKYADEAVGEGVSIAPGTQQNLGIRTLEVKLGRLTGETRAPGTIGWDLRQERVVSARVDAIVDRLHVRAPFESVTAGQPLASLIAPQWNTAVAESQAVGSARSQAARDLESASHERLRALGLPAGTRTGGGRVTLTAPVSGVVSEIGVREGQSAPTGTLLFRINGTRTVWLEADFPQANLAGVAAGTPVQAVVDALPGKEFSGRVKTVLPQIETATRTRRVRVVLDNPDGALVPGMFVQVVLQPAGAREYPLVPTEAIIDDGARPRVIVLAPDKTFRPVRVQKGRSSGGMTEILEGLEGGERIVASGQFLIDSEANLSAALDRLGTQQDLTTAPKGGEHRHPAGAMPETSRPEPAGPTAKEAPAPIRPADARQLPSPKPARAMRCRILYWYDPMKPEHHFDKPGKSPYMDMQLVPMFAPEASPECTADDGAAASHAGHAGQDEHAGHAEPAEPTEPAEQDEHADHAVHGP